MKHDSIQKFVQLRQSLLQEKATLEARLERINQALAISASPAVSVNAAGNTKSKRTMSAAVRAKMSAAHKKRWAKQKGSVARPVKKARKKMSAEGRARIAAAQKLRWDKVRAAKK